NRRNEAVISEQFAELSDRVSFQTCNFIIQTF
ncbi:MAG: hypothetical protein ACI9UV_002660, partial [Algoriphagus sp.]